MNRILKLIAIVLVLTMLTLPVLGEMGNGMMGRDKISDDMMRGKAKEMRENGSDLREKEGMMGMGFMHREGNNFGRYVTFSVNNTTVEVMNYGILGLTVFDSIKVSSFDLKDIKSMGAVTRITNKDGLIVIQLHDNPAAVINIMSKAKAEVVFDLSEGIKATKEENIVKIESGNFTAYIASGNATSVNIAEDNITIGTDKGLTIFRATPVNMPLEEMDRGFMGEIMKNRAGAEVSVGDFDKSSIVNYSEDTDVLIRSMEKNRMRMMINSSGHSGKFFMINIDNSSLVWNERQKLRLYLDNEPMRQVMSEQELYGTNESSFWLTMMGKNRMQAMMYISNFSERQVDLVIEDEVTPTATPEVTITATTTPKTPGFDVALGILCTIAVYRLRKRI